jgi:hypothetical protein
VAKRKIHLPFIFLCYLSSDEKLQLIKRLPAPIIRHLLASHRKGQLSAQAAARELGLCRAGFYKLYSQYLRACAQGQAQIWSPGLSGGNHHPQWPAPAVALLTKLISSKPPSSYSGAASELHCRLNFKTDRASVRRWALANKLTPDDVYYLRHAPDPNAKPIVLLHCPVF